MKQRVAAVAAILGLGVASAAFAQPVKMSDSQLDQVAGGQGLISVTVSDVADVSVNAPVSVTVSVLSGR
jgi:hypothetical protein